MDFPSGVKVIWLRKRDLWRIRWVDPNTGKYVDRFRRDQRDAEEEAWSVARRLALGGPVSTRAGRARTVGDLAELYLDPSTRDREWSPAYIHKIEHTLNAWVLPALVRLDCHDWSANDSRRLLHSVREAGLSDARVRQVAQVLRGMVKVGKRHGMLKHNPMDDVNVNHRRKTTVAGQSSRFIDHTQIPTLDDVRTVGEVMADGRDWWRLLQVLLVAQSGLRYGEMAYLRPEHVNLETCELEVRGQYQWVNSKEYEKLPKYDKIRTTIFPLWLRDDLERRMAEVDDDGLVFPSPNGKPHRYQVFHQKMWQPSCRKAGWPKKPNGRFRWTFHSLRHLFCTWALAAPPEGARDGRGGRVGVGGASLAFVHDGRLRIAPCGFREQGACGVECPHGIWRRRRYGERNPNSGVKIGEGAGRQVA